jgi:hypothetical protein
LSTTTHYPLVAQQVEVGVFSVVQAAPHWLTMLASEDDVGQLRECKAQAAAILAYLARRKDGSVAEHNAATKVYARVEHRLGEVLRDTVNHKGGGDGSNQHQQRSHDVTVAGHIPDGISKMQSSRAQKLAEVPWEEIAAKIDAATEKNERARQRRIIKEVLQEQYPPAERGYHYDTEGEVPVPTAMLAPPGSPAKVTAMSERYRAGTALFSRDDYHRT